MRGAFEWGEARKITDRSKYLGQTHLLALVRVMPFDTSCCINFMQWIHLKPVNSSFFPNKWPHLGHNRDLSAAGTSGNIHIWNKTPLYKNILLDFCHLPPIKRVGSVNPMHSAASISMRLGHHHCADFLTREKGLLLSYPGTSWCVTDIHTDRGQYTILRTTWTWPQAILCRCQVQNPVMQKFQYDDTSEGHRLMYRQGTEYIENLIKFLCLSLPLPCFNRQKKIHFENMHANHFKNRCIFTL